MVVSSSSDLVAAYLSSLDVMLVLSGSPRGRVILGRVMAGECRLVVGRVALVEAFLSLPVGLSSPVAAEFFRHMELFDDGCDLAVSERRVKALQLQFGVLSRG
jgi:hypothetical protein